MKLKFVSLLSLVAFSSLAYADFRDTSAAYVGGVYGYSNADHGPVKPQFTSLSNKNEKRMGARGFVGWHFDRHWNLELGHTQFPRDSYKGITGSPTADSNLRFNTHAWDLMARANLPLSNACADFYGRFGLAWINFRADGSRDDGSAIFQSVRSSRIRPTFGAGANFYLSKYVALDVSWTHIVGKRQFNFNEFIEKGKLNSPTSYLIGLGLTFRLPTA